MTDLQQRLNALTPDQRALYNKLLSEKRESDTKPNAKPPQIIPHPEQCYEPFPLTDIQQAQWFGRSGLFDITVAGHGYVEMKCDGMSLPRIEKAFQRMIDDHDQLRMVVLPNLQQQVQHDLPPYKFTRNDLRGCGKEEETRRLAEVRERMSHEILPADSWPIFEVCASIMDDDRLRIHFHFDLLVGDAWCFRMLIDEWARLYDDPEADRPSAYPLTYRDYVLALQELENSELHARDLAYWREQLLDLPPAPQLPMVRSLASLVEVRAQHFTVRLPREKWTRLSEKLGREHLTPSGFFAAVLSEVITLWNREPRLALNVTVFNRLPLHQDVSKILVGEFNSFLLLAVENATPAPFAERARRLQELLWQHLEHRWVSGVQLMREVAQLRGTSSGESLMPVVFTSTLSHHENEGSIPTRSLGEWVYEVSQTPQVWMEHHLWEEDGELLLHLDVVEGLFPKGLMEDFIDAYERLLLRLEADDATWQAPNGGHLLPDHQREAWEHYNRTDDDSLPGGLLHTAFETQAARQPDYPAIVSQRGNLSYGELDALSNSIARWLREREAQPNQLVAILAPKGWEQVASALAILKSGAAYLPLDTDAPQERIAQLLEDAQVRLVLTTSDTQKRFEWPEAVERLCVDTADLTSFDDGPLATLQRDEDIAYVIYTSGSTGKPKGVVIDHRGAVNTVQDINRRFEVNRNDRIFTLSALSFDLSVYDLFGGLSAGATLVMPDQQAPDIKRWTQIADREKITLWNTVPALMEMFVTYAEEHGLALPKSLRYVLLSGDWIPLSLPDRLYMAKPDLSVVSLGGATEASIWSIYHPVQSMDPDWVSIPYGRPLCNQRIYVLNSFLEPCPYWVQGEIYIGGVGLAKGYWRNEELTGQSFINHPTTGERLYRTGDLGRLLPAGHVEFMGRNDTQVKVRGYRIELGEIESALSKLDGVQLAVTTVQGERAAEQQLIAYVVSVSGQNLDSSELSRQLEQVLPHYMVPDTIALVDSLPLTANGKVDRKHLPQLGETEQDTRTGYLAPRTATEETICELWQELLGVERVGIRDNFFGLGGNSLVASRLLYRLHDVFEVEVPLSRLFEATTVASLAEIIEEQIVEELGEMTEEEANAALGEV
jgi:amino acid adenylation domain-containing protein